MYRQRNPGVCAAMDAFGRLTEARSCPAPAGPYAPDSAAAASTARSFLEGNREFFYLGSTLPAVARVRRHPDGRWQVRFASQVVDGCLVYGTAISVDVARAVCHAEGGHFWRVRVPSTVNVPVEEARGLIPADIMFGCWGLTPASLGPEAPRVVFPLVLGPRPAPTRLELRTAYRLSYLGGPTGVLEDVFIDVMTGEKIAIEIHVLC